MSRRLWYRVLAPFISVATLAVILTSCGGAPVLAGTVSTLTYCTNGGTALSRPACVVKEQQPWGGAVLDILQHEAFG